MLFYIVPLLIYVSFQLSLPVNVFVSGALIYGATATTFVSTVYRIWSVVEPFVIQKYYLLPYHHPYTHKRKVDFIMEKQKFDTHQNNKWIVLYAILT